MTDTQNPAPFDAVEFSQWIRTQFKNPHAAAVRLGMRPVTIRRWMIGKTSPSRRSRAQIKRWYAGQIPNLPTPVPPGRITEALCWTDGPIRRPEFPNCQTVQTLGATVRQKFPDYRGTTGDDLAAQFEEMGYLVHRREVSGVHLWIPTGCLIPVVPESGEGLA